MLGTALTRSWGATLSLLLFFGLWTGSPAFAGDRGGDDYERGAQLHEDQRYDEAAAAFMASFAAGHREDASAYNAACALARAGKKDQAFQWLDKAYEVGFDLEDYLDDDRDLRSLRGDPRFAALQAKVLGGRTSRKAREGARVAQRYQALRQQKGAEPRQYDEIGRELLEAGRYEEATRAFETAAAGEDNPATSLYNAACARALQGQQAAALDLLARAVEQGFADPHHLDEDDDLDGIRAAPRFAQIRALAEELDVPGYATQWDDHRAKNRREWQAALPRIEAAASRHPRLGQAWFNLGMARLVLGQPDAGVAPFEKAIALGYRKAASTYNVACAHALAGHSDQAFAWLDRALAAGFDGWWQLLQDADLDNIRTEPRFRKYLDLARAHQKGHFD